MSDTSLNYFIGYGTNAQRLAFTPSPATIAAAPKQLYLWYATDTVKLWGYDTGWHDLSAAGSGNVSAAGTLANNALAIGQGTTALATTTTGTGILTALGINVGSAGAPVTFNGAGGTPSSLTGTNITGVPLSTGVTGTLTGGRGGGSVLLGTYTGSGAASIDIATRTATGQTGAIFQSDFDVYEIVVYGLVPASNSVPWFRMSTNGGSSYDSGTNYKITVAYATQGDTGGYTQDSQTAINWRNSNTTLAANGSWNAEFRLFNPLSASLYKILQGQISIYDSSFYNFQLSGAYKSATAVDAFQLLMASGNITASISVHGRAK